MSQPHNNPLSNDEARQLAEHLSLVTKSGLPIAPALRAAAQEIPNPRLANALNLLAHHLESGQTLESVLKANPRFLPPHMQRLIETGASSGNLPEVLVQLIEIDRASADLKRSLRLAIAYPIVLLVLWGLLVVFLAVNVIPPLARMFADFHTTLPGVTLLLMKISGPGVLKVCAFLLAAVPMLLWSARALLSPLGWSRLLVDMPLYGPTLLWRSVANWSRLLALLVKQGIPLPEATKLAAEGVHTPLITVDGLRVSKMVASGRKLADALSTVRSLPASIVPLVRWGEDHNALPESLNTAADMFENRVQMRATLLQSVLPPLAFIVAALGILWIVNAMMLPMVKLITDLSSAGVKFGPNYGRAPFPTQQDEEAGLMIVLGLFIFWLFLIFKLGFGRNSLGGFLSMLAGGDRLPARRGFRRQIRLLLQAIAWLITFVLLLALMVVLAGAWGFLLWLATIIISISVKVRHSQMERRNLLWLLAVAVEKGILLPEAARAFASERYDNLGIRTDHLAIALEQGLPLDKALAVAGIRLPNDAAVAVNAGCATGGLAPLLKNAVRYAASIDTAIQAVVGRIVYLCIFVCFMSMVVTFIMIKIVPAYQKIFADFHQTLPPVTLALINTVYRAETFPEISAILFIALAAAFLYTLARYMGVIRWEPPVLRRLTMPLDQSLVLRALAESVGGEKSLESTLWVLAKRYPKSYIRKKLWSAAEHISEGANWCDSMVANGLLSPADAGVLKAAQRVGNLAWAMNNTADRLVRRFTTRVLGVMSISFPLVLLTFGAVVFLFAVGLIYPLAQLITHLA